MAVYGYARISTKKQSIERQIRNIKEFCPEVDKIYQEAYTGKKVSGRKEFENLKKRVKPGDTIIFDSVSRMSRNADEGINLYFELCDNGVNLVFLKERYIDTETYKREAEDKLKLTGGDIDHILAGINDYFKTLAKKQIRIAFEQAEKEVVDLSQRTKEGIKTARLNGKQIGQKEGKKLNVKKAVKAKECIMKNSKDFKGTLTDEEVMKLAGVSKNTYYKYKKELREEQ